MTKQLLFVGGAPAAGKSTMARQLSKKLSLPWVSTDQIRSALKAVANRKDYPALFNAADYDAERFLTELSAEEIVKLEIEQSEEVWIGVKAFVNDWTWQEGGIVEGVGALPRFVAEAFKDREGVRAVFLIDHDEARVREVIYKRGLWDHAHKYPDSLKEKEVEWALLFGKEVELQAKQYGYPCIEVSKSENDLDQVLTALETSR